MTKLDGKDSKKKSSNAVMRVFVLGIIVYFIAMSVIWNYGPKLVAILMFVLFVGTPFAIGIIGSRKYNGETDIAPIIPLESLHESVQKRIYYYLSTEGPRTDEELHTLFVGCVYDAGEGLYPGEKMGDFFKGEPDLVEEELIKLTEYCNVPMTQFLKDMERIGADPSTPYKFARDSEGMWRAR